MFKRIFDKIISEEFIDAVNFCLVITLFVMLAFILFLDVKDCNTTIEIKDSKQMEYLEN